MLQKTGKPTIRITNLTVRHVEYEVTVNLYCWSFVKNTTRHHYRSILLIMQEKSYTFCRSQGDMECLKINKLRKLKSSFENFSTKAVSIIKV